MNKLFLVVLAAAVVGVVMAKPSEKTFDSEAKKLVDTLRNLEEVAQDNTLVPDWIKGLSTFLIEEANMYIEHQRVAHRK
ncbi:hypothetical protein B566_EDAN005136 [Ephemera danica]|nr:hypothetical protein B566_EDAN005136 [Ephemera danica]